MWQKWSIFPQSSSNDVSPIIGTIDSQYFPYSAGYSASNLHQEFAFEQLQPHTWYWKIRTDICRLPLISNKWSKILGHTDISCACSCEYAQWASRNWCKLVWMDSQQHPQSLSWDIPVGFSNAGHAQCKLCYLKKMKISWDHSQPVITGAALGWSVEIQESLQSFVKQFYFSSRQGFVS